MNGQMHDVLRPWLLDWQKQDNSTYFKNLIRTIGRIILSNIFQTSQQHCCTTAAGMLLVPKFVAPASEQALISRFVSLYLEYKRIMLRRREFVFMLRIRQSTLYLMISLFTFSKERSTLPQNVFKSVGNKTKFFN